MSAADIQVVIQGIEALTGIATLWFTVFVFLKVGVVATRAEAIVAKTEEIHASSIEILKQTNGIMEKSNEKTELIAHAAGMQEGLAQRLPPNAEIVSKAAADAAALVLETAARRAAEALSSAATSAADKLKPPEEP